MKQQVYHPAWLFLSKLLSGLLHPAWFLCSYTRYFPAFDKNKIKKIFIGEYHCIGDVFLILPALRIIKKSFPKSELTLLVTPEVKEIAEKMNIADTILPFLAPWTHNNNSLKNWKKTISIIKKLKKNRYNMGVDFRGDFRNLFFLWLIKPKIRIGFTATGGKFLLTHPYTYPFTLHECERALFLLKKLKLKLINNHSNIMLPQSLDLRCNRIVIHPGANHPSRKWPIDYWIKLIQLIKQNHPVVLVKTENTIIETKTIISALPKIDFFEGSLFSFGSWLQNQKLLVGVDSMAVHLSTTLGIHALSIFGSQNPDLTGPLGKWGHIIKPTNICNHERENWRLCLSCLKTVKPNHVYKKILNILG